jgi:lipopolysaccharide heptosyltransferase II
MGEHQTNVVVRTPNWIGDAVLSFPSLKAIAQISERITVVAHSRTAPLFGKLSWVAEIRSFRSKKELLGNSLRLRSREFSKGVVFPLSLSSAGFIFLCGARERIGYSGGLRGVLLTQSIPLRGDYRSLHLARTYFELARTMDPAAAYSHPVLPVGPSPSHPRLVGIAPGASYGPAKRWRRERYVTLVNSLVQLRDCQVFVFGGPGEPPIRQEFDPVVRKRVEDYTGRADILQTAELVSQCRVLVTNDSGIMHLAAAVGTSVVALFGSTNPSWTGPLGKDHSVVRKPVSCSPCYRRRCSYGTYECLEKINVEEVLGCVEKYLE